MRQCSIARVVLFLALSVCASHTATAQRKPLTRTFIADTEESYQVTVAVRVETHGVSTERVGDKTYAGGFTHEAIGQVNWRSTRKISAVNADGTASLVETLDRFQLNCGGDPEAETFDSALQQSVQRGCAAWQSLAELNYQEEIQGLVRGLPESADNLIDSGSSLLSLWARRAFRPNVVFPKAPFHFGDRAAHRIENSSPDRTKPEGEESLEWLEASGEIPAATLHVSQNLTWIDSGGRNLARNVGTRPDPRQFFYADSLNTISLLDGSLLKASRSATHETKATLEPVPGLPDAPIFSSKLTITVTILRLP
jgi:hypothetical protein